MFSSFVCKLLNIVSYFRNNIYKIIPDKTTMKAMIIPSMQKERLAFAARSFSNL